MAPPALLFALALLTAAPAAPPEELVADYRAFLDQARTARLATRAARTRAEGRGFRALDPFDEAACSALRPGDRLLFALRDESLLLVQVGRRPLRQRWIGAHWDGCALRVVPAASGAASPLRAVAYGGLKAYQWRDRPLALFGRVVRRDGRAVDVALGPADGVTLLIADPPASDEVRRFTRPVVVTAAPGSTGLVELLGRRFGLREEDLAASELYLVPALRSREVGLDRALLGAPGQDDRLCAFAALRAILQARPGDRTAAALLVDREEAGSYRAGARSELVDAAQSCLGRAAGIGPDRLFAAAEALSADVKAGVDPLFPQVHELGNAPFLGAGPTLVKFTGGGPRRGSEAEPTLVASVRALAARGGVPLQGSLSGRVDEGGGGTIAMFLAQRGMQVVDIGLPVLSMHAPLEISAKTDLLAGLRLFLAFFEEPAPP